MSARLDRRGALIAGVGAVGAGLAAPAIAQGVEPPQGPWTGGGFVDVAGGRLHYVELGHDTGRPPLVLLHKLGGWVADWRHVAPLLASPASGQGRRVIAFDMPGHGQSLMYGPAPYLVPVPQSAAMLADALDRMAIDRTDFAGNSLGGITAAVIAALWPQRVRRLVIVSASLIPAMSREQLAAQDAQRAELARAARAAGHAPADPQTPTFATMDPQVAIEHEAGRARAGMWLRPSERGVGRVGVTDYLPRIAAPTLLINADRGNYVKYAEVGMRLIPHARRATIAGAGSFVHQEQPEATAALMVPFLEEVGST
ncbi:MAG TPA: alpha/beta hydrolase [Novosphingobium sp.]|nr:alpha/beta hydrolase [Novosphingobium sp.]